MPGNQSSNLGDVRQQVVDARFQPFGDATGCTTVSLDESVLALVIVAEEENRRLVSWSEHDLDVVRDYCQPDTAPRFAARHRNALAFAKQWRKKRHPEVGFDVPGRKENALANYLDLIDVHVPGEFGVGLTGDHIRRLERPASSGKEWEQLTDNQRSYWTAILGHNRYDLVGMYEVCHLAAVELAEGSAEIRPGQRPVSSSEVNMDVQGGKVTFGGCELRRTDEVRPIDGQTTSGETSSGRAQIFEVSGDDFAVEVGLVTWLTGDQDVQMLSRLWGDEPLDGLTRRLRISIRERDGSRWMELEQARLNGGRPGSYKASLEQLDEVAGFSTCEVMRHLGGKVGTRECLLEDTGRRRSGMCAMFPEDSLLAPVAAFTISRIAPLVGRPGT